MHVLLQSSGFPPLPLLLPGSFRRRPCVPQPTPMAAQYLPHHFGHDNWRWCCCCCEPRLLLPKRRRRLSLVALPMTCNTVFHSVSVQPMPMPSSVKMYIGAYVACTKVVVVVVAKATILITRVQHHEKDNMIKLLQSQLFWFVVSLTTCGVEGSHARDDPRFNCTVTLFLIYAPLRSAVVTSDAIRSFLIMNDMCVIDAVTWYPNSHNARDKAPIQEHHSTTFPLQGIQKSIRTHCPSSRAFVVVGMSICSIGSDLDQE
jgi:hypothetical protein